jgi:hypothetical protein
VTFSPSRYIHTGEGEEYRPIREIADDLDELEAEADSTQHQLKTILKASSKKPCRDKTEYRAGENSGGHHPDHVRHARSRENKLTKCPQQEDAGNLNHQLDDKIHSCPSFGWCTPG